MKPKALLVRECAWTSEERHSVGEMGTAALALNICLPKMFRSKKGKPFMKKILGPTSKAHYTAKEFMLEMLDKETIQELRNWADNIKAGTSYPTPNQSREHATLTEEQYNETLTWLSIILQNGLFPAEGSGSESDLVSNLDKWQSFLERNSFQITLTSLSRLGENYKMEVLWAFQNRLTQCCQILFRPGQHLAVKKYSLLPQQSSNPLYLALVCDLSSGFVCSMYLYRPEDLRKNSRTPVVQQVLDQLLRPFHGDGHQVQLHSSAWMEGKLTQLFCTLGVNLHFVPALDKQRNKESISQTSQHQNRIQKDSSSPLVAHLQGWTGPSLLNVSEWRGPSTDVFLLGFWATLHLICINTFVLHTLQVQGAGKRASLREFTRALASQLAMNMNSLSKQTQVPSLKLWSDNDSCNHEMETEDNSSSGCRRPGVCGLTNSGNSCYMNAVLQCLCSTVPLVEYLLSQNTRKELVNCESAVAMVFVQLLDELWLGQSPSYAPEEVRSMLGSLHSQFDNFSQQDAQELLLILLNALHDDLKKGERRQICSSKEGHQTAVGESTIITYLFEGQLKYVTICMHCEHQTQSDQVFTILSLPIPSDVFKCSLEDCLSLFFQQSTLTSGDQMLCRECGVRRNTTVQTSLVKPPEILVLHLKRFGFQGSNKRKLRTNVLFSLENLDLSPFLSSCSAARSSYSLYAVVNHTGDLDMGHYTALCHSTLFRSWYRFDDASVSEVQDYLVQSPNAYILFFSRGTFLQPSIPVENCREVLT